MYCSPALPYDPGEQGDPLHAEAPAEKVWDGARAMAGVTCCGEWRHTVFVDGHRVANSDAHDGQICFDEETRNSKMRDISTLASLVRILEQTEAEREPNLRHKTTPVSLEKDPAGHGEQSASDNSAAPAPQQTMRLSQQQQQTSFHACSPPGMPYQGI